MAKKLPLTANEAADWFLSRIDRDAGEAITHLALQKLLYFAQAWYLANRGKPLFEEDFQAWAHGPVVRSIYDRFKGSSWEALPAPSNSPNVSGEVAKLLELVFAKYGGYGAKKLEKITHEKGAPWDVVRGELPSEARCEDVIPKDLIRDYFGEKIGKSWAH